MRSGTPTRSRARRPATRRRPAPRPPRGRRLGAFFRRPAIAFGSLAAAAAVIAVVLVVALGGSSGPAQLRFAMVVQRHPTRPGGSRQGDAHEDRLRMADRADRNRPAAPAERSLLPGVAEERRRHPRAGRDVQRRAPGDAVVRRSGHPVPHVDGDPAAGERQSGVVRTPRPDRDDHSRALNFTATV